MIALLVILPLAYFYFGYLYGINRKVIVKPSTVESRLAAYVERHKLDK